MKKFDEIFRISLGSVAVKRDLNMEQAMTRRIKNVIHEVLKPLEIENRLTFFLSAVDEGMKQWLVAEATLSLQRELSLHGQESSRSESIAADPQAQSAKAKIDSAFTLLKRLVITARLNPTEFFEIVSSGEHGHLVRMAVQDQSLEWRTSSGKSTTLQPAKLPKRTTKQEACAVQFSVELVGTDKAMVRFSKPERDRLKIEETRLYLHWARIEHSELCEKLQIHRDGRHTVDALVYLAVNQYDEPKSLYFKQFILDE